MFCVPAGRFYRFGFWFSGCFKKGASILQISLKVRVFGIWASFGMGPLFRWVFFGVLLVFIGVSLIISTVCQSSDRLGCCFLVVSEWGFLITF